MEDSRFYRRGKINILELTGDYRQMGRQYGRLFKDQLNKFYKVAIDESFIKKSRLQYLRFMALARLLFRRYPAKFKEMVKGMSEASGIGMQKLIMLDQINVFEFMRNQNIGRCSNIAAWGDYAADDVLVFGRNFDQPEYFTKFNEFLTVTVLTPNDGSIPIANIGYAGQISINTAMNRQGVFIANNEVPISKDDIIDINVPSVLAREADLLMRSSNLDDLDSRIKGVRANCPIVVSVADEKKACTYEWTASRIQARVDNKNGIMVATNHFVDPSWGKPEPQPATVEKTLERRINLLSLGEKYKGRLDGKNMMELLDIKVDEGGATHSGKTTCQVVALPRDLKLYVKIPNFQDWTDISLKNSFDRLFKFV